MLAAQQCDRFAEKIIPQTEEWTEAIKKGGARKIRWAMKDSKFDPTSLVDSKAAELWIRDPKVNAHVMKAGDILNAMEAFAIYFAKGAADEETAFPSTAKVFCDNMQILAPYLVLVRSKAKDTSGGYENAINLYVLWSGRVKREELEEQAKGLGLSVEGEKRSIRPVGSESEPDS